MTYARDARRAFPEDDARAYVRSLPASEVRPDETELEIRR